MKQQEPSDNLTKTPNDASVKPCVKCGACDRDKRGNCKPCQSISNKLWRMANKEKDKERKKSWFVKNNGKGKHCDKCGTTDRYKNGACKHCASIRGKKYELENAEKIKARKAAWHSNNKDVARSRGKAWKSKNKERKKAADLAWWASNPDARKIYKQNRRVRKISAGGKLSRGLAQKLFKLQKGKCPCCQRDLGENFHMDHIKPLALGGSNTDDNIQLLRAECNLEKSKKEPIEFMQSKGFLL